MAFDKAISPLTIHLRKIEFTGGADQFATPRGATFNQSDKFPVTFYA